MIDRALDTLDPKVLQRSGRVFYTGREAFADLNEIYVLGLNPGGNPAAKAHETIAADIERFRSRVEPWSAYIDDQWNDAPAGTWGMQPVVHHLLLGLGLDPRRTPASNVVFVRSSDEAALKHKKQQLLDDCWPVHQAVIDTLSVRTILCFGKTAGLWVRERLGANKFVESYRETNDRRWLSAAHGGPRGHIVVTLTHPSRADWRNEKADPTNFVRQFIKC